MSKKTSIYARKILIALLAAACLLAMWWLTLDIARSLRGGGLRPEHILQRRLLSAGQTPKVSYIQPWMTFDYINRVFHLPSKYLKIALRVKNSAYPNLQLQNYAKEQGLNPQIFSSQVRQAVLNFPAQ